MANLKLEPVTFENLILKDIKARLAHGQGETHYTINDDAWQNFLNQANRLSEKLDTSEDSDDSGTASNDLTGSGALDLLKADLDLASNFLTNNICQKLNLNFQILRKNDAAYPKIDFLLRRRIEDKDFIEVRVAVIGNVDAGKSTVLGVLTHAELDNGRGYARQKLFRHRHELESGRTSAVGSEILGFDESGNVVNQASHHTQSHPLSATALNNLWQKICRESCKIVNFIDLAGHEKYLKTTVFGMTGHLPDFCMLIVGANQGVVGMSKEHLGLALNLNVPVFIGGVFRRSLTVKQIYILDSE